MPDQNEKQKDAPVSEDCWQQVGEVLQRFIAKHLNKPEDKAAK
jgi:hypothetical protein